MVVEKDSASQTNYSKPNTNGFTGPAGIIDNDLLQKRKRIANKEAMVSTGLNIFLFVIKISLGILISSIALTADAFHTLSDISTSLVILVSFKAAAKKPDPEHPFGHGRWEPIATLIISIMLVVAGIELFMEGIRAIHSGSHGEAKVWVAVIVLLTALSKEWLARYAIKLGKEIGSETLEADAWHHRTDALSSIGVAFAIIFSERIPAVDGIAAILVSLLIIKTGIAFIRKTSSTLLGHAPSQETVDLICRMALKEKGVLDVHDILVHDYISVRSISLDILVDRDLTIFEAHEIADRVMLEVQREFLAVVKVHVDPAEAGYEKESCSVYGK